MRSDFINKDADIKTSELCTYDSNVGYETDFNRNGDVDSWDYFDGIHTYGCWDGFLFGTLYGSYGIVGRKTVFIATPCETYYHVRIAMKYNPVPREGIHPLPNTASLRWRTLADPNWSSSKQHDFILHADNKWHTYILNMGEEQYWQGDVNDLRLHVAKEYGQDGDEFFIRTIQVFSISNYICTNAYCNYYTRYEHLCPGVGKRAYIESKKIPENTTFNVSKDDSIILNINEYGDETFNLEEVINGSVYQIAFFLTKTISIVNIGGYAEARVVYEDGRFRIYGGTYSSDSTIVIYDNALTRLFGFFDERGQAIYNFSSGEYPASGFSPWCSFRARTFELLSLFDNSNRSSLNFNPFIPSIQGGRSDWFSSLGFTSNDATNASADGTSIPVRRLHAVIRGTDPNIHGDIHDGYPIIAYGTAYTIIDFNNPFNASGRIAKIHAAVTLDPPDLASLKGSAPGGGSPTYYDQIRRVEEVKGAKILILRPRKNGYFKIIHEIPIPDRDRPAGIGIGGHLYSITQESIELDVDVFVNRGDVLGVYAANVYVGKSVLGSQIDAQYFRKEGKPTEDFHPGPLRGEGSAGLILYACSSEYQKRLTIDIDLKRRYNVKNVLIKGEPQKQYLEYNILRCLDANQFQGDTFGLVHLTAHKTMICPDWFIYVRDNTMYGLNRLTDGIKVVKDGYAADNFTITWDWIGCCNCPRIRDPAGPGVVPTNPQYFWINGDEEWLGTFLHSQWFMGSQTVKGFSDDKFTLTVYFPRNQEKKIYRTAIYFKERTNFRSFAFSVYKGDEYLAGNADNNHFNYIPGYKSIILDGVTYEKGSALYSRVDKYLFVNPTIGQAIQKFDGYYFEYSSATNTWLTVDQYTITNHEQWLQALNTDWRTIEHEFEPIAARGFRIYCDYHLSTKICEIELFCSAQDVGSNMSGGIKFSYSDYGDIWFAPEGVELEEGITELVIGDTPRYMQIELMPITELKYNDIVIGIQSEDVFVGKKGCEYDHYMIDAARGKENDSQVIELKNVYDIPYDLYVDIPPETINREGILFYSHMDTPESVTNPEFGPDAIYYKEQDYPLTFKNHNCAINCECWGLKNLVHGKTAQFKKCDRLEWDEFGVIDQNTNLNFTNVGASNRSILYLPVISRNRYWKIAHKNPNALTYVREMRVFKSEVEQPVNFYYEIGERRWGPNLCIDGTASASSSYYNDVPVNAFDNNITTYWKPSTVGPPVWLRYDLPSAEIVQCLRIKTDISSTAFQPCNFALQASVSGTFTGTDITDLLVVRKFYGYDSSSWAEWSFVENITPYKYYRLYITTNGYNTVGNMSGLRIYEMELVRPSYYRDFYNKPLERTAPHLDNGSVLGSYYKIEGNHCIGFDVGAQDNVSSLLMYHNAFDDVDALCGIDAATRTYIKAEGSRLAYTIKDISYYENPISISGSIFKENDNDFRTITWSKHEDFVDCNLPPDWKTIIGVGDGGYTSCSGGACTSAYACIPASGVDLGYTDFRITGSYSNTSGRFIETNYTEGDNKTRFQINETSVLEFRYKIQFDAMASAATINRYGTISIGLESGFNNYASSPVGLHVCLDYNADTNVSSMYLALNGDASANYVWSSRTQTIIPSGVNAVQLGVIYYIKVTSDGKGHYSASIWTDDWNGSVLIGTANITAYEKWYANKLGMFFYSANPLFDGKLYEIHCDAETKTPLKQIGGSIRVNNSNSYLEVAHNYGFDLGKSGWYSKYAAIELFAMFDRLPLLNEKFILFQNWGANGNNYMLYLSNDGTNNYIAYNLAGATGAWAVDVFADRWYHFALVKHNSITNYGSNTSVYSVLINGGVVGSSYHAGQTVDLGRSTNSVKVGIGFTGWISNFRFSSDKRYVGARVPFSSYYVSYFPVPTKEYTHRYTYSIYSSFDNITFGKYADVDLFNGYTNVYYSDKSTLGSFYNSFFAIDLNQRHNLDIIRSYNNASAFGFDSRKYISYSNDDTANVENVSFTYTDDISDNFEGLGKPNTFLWSYTDNVDLYLDAGKVRMQLSAAVRTQELKSKYTLIGDFDIRVSYSILTSYNIINWYAGLGIENVINNNRVYIFRSFSSPDGNCYYSTDHTGTMSFNRKTSETLGTLKIRRRGQTITTYFKKGTEWETLDQWVDWSFDDVRVVLYAYNTGLYPALSIYFNSFESPLFLTNSPDSSVDVRWVRVNMPNGDTTARQLYKIGIYPDIRDRFAPSKDRPNSYWDFLGPAVTNYDEGVNLGPTSEVTASSYVERFLPGHAANGTIGTKLNETWASGQGQSQWINLDFGEVKSIYRVKLYLGYNENDPTMLATAYKIQVSTDGITYTDIFSITGNTSFVRTHDLMTPVSTRHVRVYISAYKYRQMYLLSGDTMVLFSGVTMREIEVYESYGFITVSSEIYPILAVNLREQFYINGHEVVGVNTESTATALASANKMTGMIFYDTTDWDNLDSSFAYSDSVFTDPSKIEFRSFGGTPSYDQWVAIRRNTATNYGIPYNAGTATYINMSGFGVGTDYLKHVKIKAVDAPNPCDYFWWWSSNVSTITRSFNVVSYCMYPLKIEYPASTVADNIYIRPGDNFGVDTMASWRDGLTFRLHIDDLNNLDLSYGYFYIKGIDATSVGAPVEYRWYLSTLSGTGLLQSGWCWPFLSFKYADEVVHNKDGTSAFVEGKNPLRADEATFDSIGFTFRGKGNPIIMYFDGFVIGRNHFSSYSAFGQGLYLTGNDVLTCPLGGFDLIAGTIEFWIRPDWTFTGQDNTGRFKSRSIFHFGNAAGDVFGMTIGTRGLYIYYGDTVTTEIFTVTGLSETLEIDGLYHMAVVFSCNGIATSDGSTIKLYINNHLMAKHTLTWKTYDNKLFKFIFGGQGLLGVKENDATYKSSSLDSVISNLKIYSFCKLDFADSMANISDDFRVENILKPSELIEISKDNVTFYKVGDTNLPFFFEKVPPGTVVPIYVKTDLPLNLTGAEKRTSAIVSSWDVGV